MHQIGCRFASPAGHNESLAHSKVSSTSHHHCSSSRHVFTTSVSSLLLEILPISASGAIGVHCAQLEDVCGVFDFS